MTGRSDIRKGMAVHSRDGVKVGRILSVSDEGFVVEKGFFRVRDYLVRFADVVEVRGDDVRLSRTRDELERHHREGAVAAAVQSKDRLSASPGDFAEARMDSAKFQNHEGYTPTAGGWGHREEAGASAGMQAAPSGNLGLGPTDLDEARMDSAKFQNHERYVTAPTGEGPHGEVEGPRRRASGPGWDALGEDEDAANKTRS